MYRFAFPRNLSDVLASLIKDGDVTGLLGLPKPDGSGVLPQLLGRPEGERGGQRMLRRGGDFGSDEASSDTDEGRAQNRRVAVNILVSKAVDGIESGG